MSVEIRDDRDSAMHTQDITEDIGIVSVIVMGFVCADVTLTWPVVR
jgi:hypothetical protein